MIKEKAYAKINLFLNVVGKRIDGYHDLEMVMAPLQLHDLLTFKILDEKKIIITSNKEITKNIEDNVVFKIASFVQEAFSVPQGVEINIVKNIPLAGGLAGGSADAAATLRGLNKLWGLKLCNDDMAKLGIEFGADIPFCVYNKLAIAKGKGDQLTFINQKLKTNILVLNPNIEVSTLEVFTKFEEKNLVDKTIVNLVESIHEKDYGGINRELFNGLEQITFELVPELRQIKNWLIDSRLEGTLMSGSGATLFSLSKDMRLLQDVSNKINSKYYHTLTKFHN